MGKTAEVALTAQEREALEKIVGSPRADRREVFRAKIILMSEDRWPTRLIASQLGTSRQTVSLWRGRFARERMLGLKDRPGRGRKRGSKGRKREASP